LLNNYRVAARVTTTPTQAPFAQCGAGYMNGVIDPKMHTECVQSMFVDVCMQCAPLLHLLFWLTSCPVLLSPVVPSFFWSFVCGCARATCVGKINDIDSNKTEASIAIIVKLIYFFIIFFNIDLIVVYLEYLTVGNKKI